MRIAPISLVNNFKSINFGTSKAPQGLGHIGLEQDTVEISKKTKYDPNQRYMPETREAKSCHGGQTTLDPKTADVLSGIDKDTNAAIELANKINSVAEEYKDEALYIYNTNRMGVAPGGKVISGKNGIDTVVISNEDETVYATINKKHQVSRINVLNGQDENGNPLGQTMYVFNPEDQKLEKCISDSKTLTPNKLAVELDDYGIRIHSHDDVTSVRGDKKAHIDFNYKGNVATARFETKEDRNATIYKRTTQKTAVHAGPGDDGFAVSEHVEDMFRHNNDETHFVEWVRYDD